MDKWHRYVGDLDMIPVDIPRFLPDYAIFSSPNEPIYDKTDYDYAQEGYFQRQF